ncbi:MAG: YfcE family phosphodiesterase [Clostridia bacterium]|nr:YfcE family phosphodiesterase [Clostridia bacterium]
MQRALILSDIHGEENGLRWMLEEVWKTVGPIDAYLCLGDGVRDFDRAESFIRRRDPHAAMIAVRGNCDFVADYPERRVIPFGGLKLYMTHGHIHRVKSGLDYLYGAARAEGADIALYGHTHRANVEYTTPWLINPGAAKDDCCALLEIDGGKPHVKLISLGFK